jgi:two-component system, LytTR family, sensor kinase
MLGVLCCAALLRSRLQLQHRLAALDDQLVRARLHEHRSRIGPHLLLNALSSISVLGDEENAPRVVDAAARLAALLRCTLKQSPLTSLRREVAFLERYVAVERVRFGDRMNVMWSIDDACLDAQLPALLLQPIVENAVHHGLTPATGSADVTIGAARQGDRLRLWVSDRGPGLNGARRGGSGLRLIRDQLELFFAGRYTLDITSGRGPGVTVIVTLPLTMNGDVHHDDSHIAGG